MTIQLTGLFIGGFLISIIITLLVLDEATAGDVTQTLPVLAKVWVSVFAPFFWDRRGVAEDD